MLLASGRERLCCHISTEAVGRGSNQTCGGRQPVHDQRRRADRLPDNAQNTGFLPRFGQMQPSFVHQGFHYEGHHIHLVMDEGQLVAFFRQRFSEGYPGGFLPLFRRFPSYSR